MVVLAGAGFSTLVNTDLDLLNRNPIQNELTTTPTKLAVISKASVRTVLFFGIFEGYSFRELVYSNVVKSIQVSRII